MNSNPSQGDFADNQEPHPDLTEKQHNRMVFVGRLSRGRRLSAVAPRCRRILTAEAEAVAGGTQYEAATRAVQYPNVGMITRAILNRTTGRGVGDDRAVRLCDTIRPTRPILRFDGQCVGVDTWGHPTPLDVAR